MRHDDPRLKEAERLLLKATALITEVRAGVAAPRKSKRRRKRINTRAVLAALQEGALMTAKGDERDPRLPPVSTLAGYRKRNPRFDAQIKSITSQRCFEACRRRRPNSPIIGIATESGRLPGKNYDWNAIAEKIEGGATIGPYSTNRRGLPSHTLIMARRKTDPEFAARVTEVLKGRTGGRVRNAVDKPSVLELIRNGAVIKAEPPQPGMPRKAILDGMRKADPAFNADMLEAISEARRRRFNRLALSKRNPETSWIVAEGAIPRLSDADLRRDIVGELNLQICEGIVGLGDDLAAAWKRCRTRLSAPRWIEVSLDAPIPGTDGLRRIDSIPSDALRC